jgi:hypothetical protein
MLIGVRQRAVLVLHRPAVGRAARTHFLGDLPICGRAGWAIGAVYTFTLDVGRGGAIRQRRPSHLTCQEYASWSPASYPAQYPSSSMPPPTRTHRTKPKDTLFRVSIGGRVRLLSCVTADRRSSLNHLRQMAERVREPCGFRRIQVRLGDSRTLRGKPPGDRLAHSGSATGH